MNKCGLCGLIYSNLTSHPVKDCLNLVVHELTLSLAQRDDMANQNTELKQQRDQAVEAMAVAEQTLRNLANGELRPGSDAQQIAENAARRLRDITEVLSE